MKKRPGDSKKEEKGSNWERRTRMTSLNDP